MPETTAKLVNRAERLSFMDTGASGTAKYERMTKFTALTGGKNPKEYSRQYVDMLTESSDVVGYAPSVDYSFDMHTNTPVHQKIASISDDELVGSDTYVDIVTVDIFTQDKQNRAIARKRTYSVVPDSDGDGTDALIYSGSFKAVSEITKGYATSEDNWQTCTFTEGEIPQE